jgi:glyoxylase I family protein
MFKRIDHVEILPSDPERTIVFYQEVLGFTLAGRFPVDTPLLKEIVYLKLADTMVEVLATRTPASATMDPPQVGYHLLALEVENMEQAIAYLASKGIAPTWGPVRLRTSVRAEIPDPDGLPIELRQWMTRP